MFRKITLCIVMVLFVLSSVSCKGEEYTIPETSIIYELEEPTQREKQEPQSSVQELQPIAGSIIKKMTIRGKLCGYAYCTDSGLYIDPCDIIKAYEIGNAKAEITEKSARVSVTDILILSANKGENYICANDRYFYMPNDFLISDGRAFLPVEVITKIFGLEETEDSSGNIEINADSVDIIQGGKYYYDVNFPAADVYWLAHIIEAEADNQPIEGMIGVGNVVLNRVKSELYPETIFEVIFQYQGAAQFSPVMSTSMSRDIIEKVYVATCLCLEGYETAKDCLFFQNTLLADAKWIELNREHSVRLGDMDFYY